MNTYLSELVRYGGEIMTRGEMIADLQRIAGGKQALVDRYLQGHELCVPNPSNAPSSIEPPTSGARPKSSPSAAASSAASPEGTGTLSRSTRLPAAQPALSRKTKPLQP